jgi:hypothetical protein
MLTRFAPLTGWGPRRNCCMGRRLPDTLAGGIVRGLEGAMTTHQARESQMEMKNVEMDVEMNVEAKAHEDDGRKRRDASLWA